MCGHRYRSRGHQERRSRDRSVRASDADRDRTTEVLREQAGLGRLEPDELEERLEAALSAKTLADLDALIADLPVGAREPRERARHRKSFAPFAFSPLVLIVSALVAVSIAIGHPVFWLFFLLFFVHWRPRAALRLR